MPGRLFRWRVFALALATGVAGCNAILGNTLHDVSDGGENSNFGDATISDAGADAQAADARTDVMVAGDARADAPADGGADGPAEADSEAAAEAGEAGCELGTLSNCAACGDDCAAQPHVSDAGLACTGGRCVYSCAPGYADCADAGGGCATALSSNANCGACGAGCGGTGEVCAATDAGGYGCAEHCAVGETACAGSCTNLEVDPANCGGCGTACAGSETCGDGGCGCPAGQALCGGGCVDPASDSMHCGPSCVVCMGGTTCQGGSCMCTPGTTLCNGACVDVNGSDVANCGACGRSCAQLPSVSAAGLACSNGSCVYQCASGFADCGDAGAGCATSLASTASCGGCGTTCGGATPECAVGDGGVFACASGCASGQTNCGGTCSTLPSDPNHCGSCPNACTPPSLGVATCTNGVCGGACPNGLSLCGNACLSCTGGQVCVPSASGCQCPAGTLNCGGTCQGPAPTNDCGGSCTTGCQGPTNGATGSASCSGSTCAITCNPGRTNCSGACVDETSDSANCGACGKTCTNGSVCEGSVCTCPTGNTENCNNGVDDNCDGLVDCADPQCSGAGYSCVTLTPSGWLGPVAFASGSSASQLPACPANYANTATAQSGLASSADTCACSCSETVAPQCGVADGNLYEGANSCNTTPTLIGTSCQPISIPPNANGFSVASGNGLGTTLNPGACGASSTTTSGGAPTWTTTASLCGWDLATDTGGCAATQECVSSAGSSQSLCVYQSGVAASCPAGYQTTGPLVFYTGTSDTRGCPACSCTTATPMVQCDVTITVYSGSNCTGTTQGFLGGATCSSTGFNGLGFSPGSAEVTAVTVIPTAPSVCVASVAAPTATGTVTPTGPISVCCR